MRSWRALASRRLDLRSALGSYAIACQLPWHVFSPAGDIDPCGGYTSVSPSDCGICGSPARPGPADLNLYSFERFKWGGVRRDDVSYIAFDLEQFSWAPEPGLSSDATAIAASSSATCAGLRPGLLLPARPRA